MCLIHHRINDEVVWLYTRINRESRGCYRLGVQIHFIEHRKISIGKQRIYIQSESDCSYSFNHHLFSCNVCDSLWKINLNFSFVWFIFITSIFTLAWYMKLLESKHVTARTKCNKKSVLTFLCWLTFDSANWKSLHIDIIDVCSLYNIQYYWRFMALINILNKS